MHLAILFVATLIAGAVALPQGASTSNDQSVQSRHFRNGRPNRRPSHNGNGNVPNLPPGNQTPPVFNNGTNNDQSGNNGEDAIYKTPPAQNITFDPSLVPEFGIAAGQQPDGTGNCVGNKGVLIPCACPPDRKDFIQRVQAAAEAGNSEGVPISFPTGDSSADVRARIGASIVVLQNLNGRGVGCPAAATTFLQQQAEASQRG